MVAPTDDTELDAATYTPTPFEGLPEVFTLKERAPRGWRGLRPKKAERKGRAEPAPGSDVPIEPVREVAPAGPAEKPRQEPPHHLTVATGQPEPAPRAFVSLPPLDETPPEPVPAPTASPGPAHPVDRAMQVAPAAQVNPIAPPAEPPQPAPAPRDSATLPPPDKFQPEPTAEMAPEPTTDIAPEPAVEVAPEPTAEVAPEPIATPEPAAETAPEPTTAPAAPPVELTPVIDAEPEDQPIAAVEVEPAAEPAPQPALRRAVFSNEVRPTDSARASQPSAARAATVPAAALAAPGVSYEPDPFDPDGAVLPRLAPPTLSGVIYPARRTHPGVRLMLSLILAVGVAFVGWRVLRHDNATPEPVRVAYHSAAGHFTAEFPAPPIERASKERDGRNRLALHVAGVPDAATVVAGVDISGPVPPNHRRATAEVVQAFGSTDEMTITSIHAASFRGHPARQGRYLTPDGRLLTIMIVGYSVRHYYLLMAPEGDDFEALKQSFTTRR